jgi:hypothetical protein
VMMVPQLSNFIAELNTEKSSFDEATLAIDAKIENDESLGFNSDLNLTIRIKNSGATSIPSGIHLFPFYLPLITVVFHRVLH